jgi:iron complex outermembrane receptor protein
VLQQQISDRVSLSGDVHYAARESLIDAIFYGSLNEYLSDSKQYGGSVGLQVDIARDWQIRFNGLLDQSDSELTHFQHFPGGVQTNWGGNESRLLSADLAVDGAIINIQGGEVRLALGAHGRRETFEEQADVYPAELSRDVGAVYAEVNIPVVGDGNSRAWLEYVDLTLAARYEDYSDFGDTFNPKVGVAFSPSHGLNLRGTWGTSFKAPLLNQLNPADRYAVLYDGFFLDEQGAGTVAGLHLLNNSETLGAEESTNWTAGLDFRPPALPQLSLSATYFEIDYNERIRSPFPSSYQTSAVLSDPLYASVVTRNPSRSTVDSLIQGARHSYCFDYLLGDFCDISEYAARVGVIVDERLRNLAGVELSGLDISLNYTLSNSLGEWGLRLHGSRMLKNRQQVIAGSPSTNEMNDVWQPVDLRLRGSVSFNRGDLSVVASIGYVDDYQDRRPGSTRSTVASWATVDLSAQYEFRNLRSTGWLDNLTVQFGAINLFDRDPPFVSSNSGLNYDGVNANALGRFLSMQITAQWGRR